MVFKVVSGLLLVVLAGGSFAGNVLIIAGACVTLAFCDLLTFEVGFTLGGVELVGVGGVALP